MAKKAIWLCEVTSIKLLLCVGIKSCGRVADKFGLRTWIFGFACLVFRTTCVDREKPLREGAFFFTRMTLFPRLDKRNTRDKAKGLRVASERSTEELIARCLSTLNRGQDSAQQPQSPRYSAVVMERRVTVGRAVVVRAGAF